MAFESLSNRLTAAFKHIAGKDQLNEKNMEAMLREVRIALLEADVNYGVVKKFINSIREQMIGVQVSQALNPDQQVYKIVNQEIINLLGQNEAGINYRTAGITTIMVVGLQGTGKTTSVAKIAKLIRDKQSRKPLIIAGDIIRPAAIEQLQTLGEQIGVEVFTLGPKTPAVDTVKAGLNHAQQNGYDTVLIDTAGRLHIDDDLMKELDVLKKKFHPDEILLTVDSMTGQDIVNVARTFDELLDITGLIVTKFDGDARGGGVLSVRSITDVPVKFVGNGEKIDDIDVFYPDRMASRILGMGDLQTLVEKAEAQLDEELMEKTAQRMMSGKFDLNDMLVQMDQMKKLGPISGLLKMLPGFNQYADMMNDADADSQMKKTKAIIQSMTPYERSHPETLRSSHKNRIAKGSGTSVSEVNKLLNNFERMKKVMNQMGAGFRMFR
ncbi:MAG: signal recognition particle protein [Erysipelotrichaceae bacterium]|nr:signal recognition particle protein [Erysipelotrichaceae bacterium]